MWGGWGVAPWLPRADLSLHPLPGKLKMLEKEIASQDEDHFITVDAVGCFEGDEEEEEDDDDEEEIEVEEEFCKQVLGGRWCGTEAGGWTPSPGETSPRLPGARRHRAGIFGH